MKSLTRPLRVMHIISGDLWAGAEVQAYTLLKQLQQHAQLKVILLNDGELGIKLRQLGIELIILPEANLNSLQLFFGIFWQVFKFNPNIFHTHRQKENILGGIANFLSSLLGRGGKSLRTVHGAPEFGPRGLQKIQVWLDKVVGKFLQSRLIAVSQDLQSLIATFYPPEKICIIRNGVDIDALKIGVSPANLGGKADAIHVGIIGRVEPIKRIDIFLDTASILHQARTQEHHWHFHIIGDGNLKADFVKGAAQQGLSSVVTFHGHRQDIPNCIAALDAVLMCSDHEGTPMVALETLALGVPLVGHNVGGLREVLHTYPEFLVDDHQAEAYAQRLKQICCADLAGPVSLDEQYSAGHNLCKTLALYEMLCG